MEEKDDSTLAIISSLYAMVLVSVYVAFVFTELVTFPVYESYLEKTGFFIYLYLVRQGALTSFNRYTLFSYGKKTLLYFAATSS